MKIAALLCLFASFNVFANDSLEKDYIGATTEGEICRIRIRDSQGSASFHYREGGESKSCSFTYDRYFLTNQRDDGRTYSTLSDKFGFKSCKMQVYYSEEEGVARIRMGLKSIFNPFHKYEECRLASSSDTL
tara:strand:+ start:11392 stop:11787 length:396 start_codon:yes stop_codon:yes gene_type:complete